MAERAHPDLEGFRDRWKLGWRYGVIPWPFREKNPYRAEFFWRYSWVTPHCQGRDVLDVPCGMGWGTSLIEGTRSLVGMDISEESIAEARQRYGSTIDFRVGSMEKLAFDDASLDTVVCLEGIEHVPQAIGRSFLDEVRRVLRPGGFLLLSSPHCKTGKHSGNPYHIYEYPPAEIREELASRFRIEDTQSREVDNLVIHYFRAARAG